MKNLQSFEEFVNENLNESFDPMKPTSLKKLFKGFPVEFSVGDADGRDYNKYIKMWTNNMKDSDKESIMRTIQSTKFAGVSKNNVHVSPNNGGGLTLTINYFDDDNFQ